MADMSDLYSLFGGADPTAQEKAIAIANALRGQQAQAQQQLGLGQAFSLHPLLAQQGRGLVQSAENQLTSAQQGQEHLASTMGEQLRRSMDAQREAQAEKHQSAQERLQQEQIDQGKYTLSRSPYGQDYLVNGKDGTFQSVGTPQERPPPRGQQSADDKEWKDYFASLSTVKGRANLNAENQKRLYSSERLKALAQIPDPTPQQLEEIALASAQLASGSGATESAVKAMLPKGMGVKAADLTEWLTNTPRGAGQQAFVKMMLDQAAREEKVIHGQMAKGQTQELPRFMRLRGLNKDKFDAGLTAAGLNPSFVSDTGLYQMQDEGGTGGSGPVKITTKEEFDALPSGAEFLDPKGNHRRKP